MRTTYNKESMSLNIVAASGYEHKVLDKMKQLDVIDIKVDLPEELAKAGGMTEEKRGDGLLADKYEQLKGAVQDLLCELRIGPDILEVMAKGYSPSYPGAPIEIKATATGEPRTFDNSVQISKVVAEKLVNAGIT